MIAFNGMASYAIAPEWLFILLLEVGTVFIETAGFLMYWKFRGGALRWFEVFIVVAGINLLTAVLGLMVYNSVYVYDGSVYANSGMYPAGEIMFTTAFLFVVLALICGYLSRGKAEAKKIE